MLYRILFSILILTVTISCNKNQNSEIIITRQIEFNPGFNIAPTFKGTFFDKNTNQEYIYFGDIKTSKCLKTFNLNGEFTDSIPLDKALLEIGGIKSISFISIDTILINSPYTNKIIAINRNGDCRRYLSIDDILPDSLKYYYEFSSSILSNPYESSDNIAFRAWPKYPNLLNKYDMQNIDTQLKTKFFYSQLYEEPLLLKIENLFNDTPSIKFSPENLYKYFYEKGDLLEGISAYKCIGNNIFYISRHSDEILKIDANSLKLSEKIKIKSDYTTIGTKPIKVGSDRQDFENKREIEDKKLINNGSIYSFFFNDIEQLFYIVVVHTITEEEMKSNKYGYFALFRPFSIITYDKNFNNRKEYAIEGNKYKFPICLMTDSGLLILKKNTENDNNKKGSYEKQVFDLLDFN